MPYQPYCCRCRCCSFCCCCETLVSLRVGCAWTIASWCCRGLQVYEKHMYIGVRTTPPEEIVTYDSQRIPIRVKFTVTYEIRDPARAAQFRSKYGKPSVGSQCWLPVLLMPKGGCCPVPVAVVW